MDVNHYLNWWKERNSRDGYYGRVTVEGITVDVHQGVFSPAATITHSTTMTIRRLPHLSGKSFLDIGTGTGILAIFAAQQSAGKITAVDLQKESVHNARQNVKAHGFADRIEVFQSDVFQNVSGKYDVIVANLPIMDRDWHDLNPIAMAAYERFFNDLPKHLHKDGSALFTFTSWGDVDTLQNLLDRTELSVSRAEEDCHQATWYLYHLKDNNNSSA